MKYIILFNMPSLYNGLDTRKIPKEGIFTVTLGTNIHSGKKFIEELDTYSPDSYNPVSLNKYYP